MKIGDVKVRIPIQKKPNMVIIPKKGKGSYNRAKEKRMWKKSITLY